MGTHINTKMTHHDIKEFWGGDERGVCLQITASSAWQTIGDEGYIQVTMEEAAELCNDLARFVKRDAIRRQGLLRESIKQAQICERTVFTEIAELPDEFLGVKDMVVSMVSRFCPKVKSPVE
jgi:hypothetical protein